MEAKDYAESNVHHTPSATLKVELMEQFKVSKCKAASIVHSAQERFKRDVVKRLRAKGQRMAAAQAACSLEWAIHYN